MSTVIFDWTELISEIEAADRANKALEIDLPPEIWEALNRVASKLSLQTDGSRYYLLVARFCTSTCVYGAYRRV